MHPPFARAEFFGRIDKLLPLYESSGLKEGDEIVALNGKAIESARQFEDSWLALQPNQTFALERGDILVAFGLPPAPHNMTT